MSQRMLLPNGPDRITIENLRFRPDPGREPVLDCSSFTFEKGHFYGIIGPNGAGKTSLLLHLLRLIRAETGTISLNEININEFRRRELSKHLSYVPQKVDTGISYSVRETVMMGRSPHLKMFSYPGKDDCAAVSSAMKAAGIEKLSDYPVSVLSGGELRSVLLARSVAQGCPWLFLDEPVSSLDICRQYSVMNMLSALRNDEGKTMVCVLHDMNLASAYCDRLIVMNEGKIVDSGDSSTVLTPELLYQVYGLSFRRIEFPEDPKTLFVPIPRNPRDKSPEDS